MTMILSPDEVTEFFEKVLAYQQRKQHKGIRFDKIPQSLTDTLLSRKLSSEATRFLLYLCRLTLTANKYQGTFTFQQFSDATGIERRAFNNLRNELDNGIFITKEKQFDCQAQAQDFPFFHLEDLGKKSVEQGSSPVKRWQVTYLRPPFEPHQDLLTGWYVGTGEKVF